MTAALGLQVAATFTWLGMVLAISFVEAPLKFRAPGITVPLGVGIGRLVFRALNIAETVLALVVAGALAARAGHADSVTWVLAGILWTLLLLHAAVLRPLMDRKVVAGGVSSGIPRTVLHAAYIGLEVAKVGILVAFGIVGLVSAG